MQIIYGGSLLMGTTMSSRLWLLPALPLAGALLCGLGGGALGRRFGRRAVSVVAVGAMVVVTAVALSLVIHDLLPLPAAERSLHQTLWPMFSLAGVDVTLGLTLDALSATMILIVTGVGTLIHVYAAGYMKNEPSLARFFAYLNLFVFAMLLLALGDGFVTLLFGWEGVGVCSYLLIGFWFRRPAAADAAMKAFIVNRVGDCGLLLGVALLVWGMGGGLSPAGGHGAYQAHRVIVDAPSGGAIELRTQGDRSPQARLREVRIGPTLGFRELADQVGIDYGPSGDNGHGVNQQGRPFADALSRQTIAGVPLMFVVCALLLLGAAGKSAQIPLFAWLPDAMVGPTPVSALIHAATMVTAGVYLMARLGFLFALSPGALTLAAVIGVMTAFLGATAGCLQWDLKRVLAYSTVSQLGFMFASAGAGGFSASMFHLVTHAFFKACLFLAAGSVIHAVNHIESGESSDPQDMRNMGGLAAALPWTRLGYLAACLAIAGFPVASGFYSKDAIFASILGSQSLRVSPRLLWGGLAVTTALTAFYMFRSYFLIFFARPARFDPGGATHEPSRRMTAVVLTLAAGSLVVGPLLGWPRLWGAGHTAPVLERFLSPGFAAAAGVLSFTTPSPQIEWTLQFVGVVLAGTGFLAARSLYRHASRTSAWRARTAARFAGLVAWLSGGWGFDALYRELVLAPVRDFARAAAWIDRRLIDPLIDAVARLGISVSRTAGLFDRRVLDGAVDAVSHLILAGGRQTARLQSGRVGTYVLAITTGVAALVVLAYVLGP